MTMGIIGWRRGSSIEAEASAVCSWTILVLALSGIFVTACTPANPDVQIDAPYRAALLSNPVLRNAGGGIIVERAVAPPLLIGIGYAIIPRGQSLDACAKEVNEARFEAISAAASANARLCVVAETSSGNYTTVTIVNGEERAEVIEKTTRITRIQFASMVKGLRPVGRWRGTVGEQEAIFVAMGTVLQADTITDSGPPTR